MDNIKTSELKDVIKTIVRESISERSQAPEASSPKKEAGDKIPRGKLAQLNPKIASKGDKDKMKLSPNVKEAGLTSEEGETPNNSSLTPKECTFIFQMLRGYQSTHTLSRNAQVAFDTILDKISALGKMNEASYKQVSPNAVDTVADDKARKIQTEPKVNEASYKVVAPRMATDTKEDKARKIQIEPKVNETAYKTQGPSLKTFEDSPQFPKAVNDPENA